MLMNVLHCLRTYFVPTYEWAPVRQVRTKPTDGGHTLNVATHMWQYIERAPVCTLKIKDSFFSKRPKVSVISLQSAGEFPPLLPTLSSPPPSVPSDSDASGAQQCALSTSYYCCWRELRTSCYASRRTNWQILQQDAMPLFGSHEGHYQE